jgi:hypothetical protein
MNWPRYKKYAIRAVITLAISSSVIVILGLLPGTAEGVYYGPQCMCECTNYTILRDGRIILYSTGHSPASIIGRYEIAEDGAVNIFMPTLMTDEKEELNFRMRPRLLYSMIQNVESGATDWMCKRPSTSNVKRMIKEQEITAVTIPNQHEIVTTFYDHNFKQIRVEKKPIKKAKEAEQAAPRNR